MHGSLTNRLKDSSLPAESDNDPSSSPPASVTSTCSTSLFSPTVNGKPVFRTMSVVSPRSSNYDRLEGGMGPSRMKGRKMAWKKFALGAVVLIGLVWFFGPGESSHVQWGDSLHHDVPLTKPHDHEVDTKPLPAPPDASPQVVPPVHDDDDTAAKPSVPSFETDPDPSKTTHCTHPDNPDAHLVQYALMIDAGSTGSRIHIYKFNNCGPSPAYEYEVFKMVQPGLSSYKGRPLEAAMSLDVLLNEAVRVVPEELRKCTPVAVKATAGLRLLGPGDSTDILEAVETRLHGSYPFHVQENGVLIMDGKDEGVYAWITANYLLKTIRSDTPSDTPTYAVLDLGGASTQIVFKPTFSKPDSSLVDGEHKYDLTFGGKTHVLYQHSYLGYGLMRARASVHRLVDFMASLRAHSASVIANPCLAKGTRKTVEVRDEMTGTTKNVTMVGEDVGGFEACNRVVELVMAKDAICEVKPCSFDGVYQPSLLDTFPSGKILLLSYFYDRLKPLLPKDDRSPITVSTLADMAREVCLGPTTWVKRWEGNMAALEELEGRPEYCLDLTFMHGLLRLGYELEDQRAVVIGKQIEMTELGWCLGATIAMVGGDLRCRI